MNTRLCPLLAALIISFTQLALTAQVEQSDNKIQLLIRGDDIGSFHAANVACIRSYTDGIMRSVEIMVPCPWYPEAVKLINRNPGLDVGIHLVLTSEWENMKWRPLTGISSLTDEKGYFFPMVWANDRFPPERVFRESGWNMIDLEKEIRAQIERAIKDIPKVSHITTHMGFASADPSIDSLVGSLSREYDLHIDLSEYQVKRFPFSRGNSLDERIDSFIAGLRKLKPGNIYLFVEHPALDSPEMETIGHEGYYSVGKDRQMVTDMFTSDRVIDVLNELGIELISYAGLTD
ncbi:MAG: ChbG/HpnK family deacetylase [Bacteroidales bacterium]|nr:ChbG/HpnK family deacetylase [Bacteroidales bacterium]